MFINLLRNRRSVRNFQDKPVEKEMVDFLVEAMLRSPSSRDFKPWEFVVVSDREKIIQLSKAKTHGSTFLKNAPLAIVVCADPVKSDVWVEDCSIAATLLHLAASDMGLGSCWVQIRLRNHDEQQTSQAYVAELLGLKTGMAVEAIIAIGYPKEEKSGHPKSSLLYDKVSYEYYGQKE
ncbi:MAG: nitroreductase family protein [Desulfobacterales bacterium]|nr:nitroreductase family protein [Desulfobacterales bacterium]